MHSSLDNLLPGSLFVDVEFASPDLVREVPGSKFCPRSTFSKAPVYALVVIAHQRARSNQDQCGHFGVESELGDISLKRVVELLTDPLLVPLGEIVPLKARQHGPPRPLPFRSWPVKGLGVELQSRVEAVVDVFHSPPKRVVVADRYLAVLVQLEDEMWKRLVDGERICPGAISDVVFGHGWRFAEARVVSSFDVGQQLIPSDVVNGGDILFLIVGNGLT